MPAKNTNYSTPWNDHKTLNKKTFRTKTGYRIESPSSRRNPPRVSEYTKYVPLYTLPKWSPNMTRYTYGKNFGTKNSSFERTVNGVFPWSGKNQKTYFRGEKYNRYKQYGRNNNPLGRVSHHAYIKNRSDYLQNKTHKNFGKTHWF